MRTSPLLAYRVPGGVIASSPPAPAKVTVTRKAARRIFAGASICAIPLQHRHAAARAEMLAGDERSLGRTEKGDRCCNFGRVRGSADADDPPGRHFRHLLENSGSVQPGSRKPGGIGLLAPSALVSIAPGETQLTVIPCRTISPAKVIVNPIIDPLPMP